MFPARDSECQARHPFRPSRSSKMFLEAEKWAFDGDTLAVLLCFSRCFVGHRRENYRPYSGTLSLSLHAHQCWCLYAVYRFLKQERFNKKIGGPIKNHQPAIVTPNGPGTGDSSPQACIAVFDVVVP